MAEKNKRYRVKDGRSYGPAGVHKAGSIVHLTPEEAKPHMDKLLPLDDLIAEGKKAQEQAKQPDTGLKNEAGLKVEPLVPLAAIQPDETTEESVLTQAEETPGGIDLTGKNKSKGKGK